MDNQNQLQLLAAVTVEMTEVSYLMTHGGMITS